MCAWNPRQRWPEEDWLRALMISSRQYGRTVSAVCNATVRAGCPGGAHTGGRSRKICRTIWGPRSGIWTEATAATTSTSARRWTSTMWSCGWRDWSPRVSLSPAGTSYRDKVDRRIARFSRKNRWHRLEKEKKEKKIDLVPDLMWHLSCVKCVFWQASQNDDSDVSVHCLFFFFLFHHTYQSFIRFYTVSL